jgi:hypothetical protein
MTPVEHARAALWKCKKRGDAGEIAAAEAALATAIAKTARPPQPF